MDEGKPINFSVFRPWPVYKNMDTVTSSQSEANAEVPLSAIPLITERGQYLKHLISTHSHSKTKLLYF